jgi:hypothetical protein
VDGENWQEVAREEPIGNSKANYWLAHLKLRAVDSAVWSG